MTDDPRPVDADVGALVLLGAPGSLESVVAATGSRLGHAAGLAENSQLLQSPSLVGAITDAIAPSVAAAMRQRSDAPEVLGALAGAMAALSGVAPSALGCASAGGIAAHHDPLTGLPNRVLLQDRLEQALRVAERTGSMVAVMVCDLDRFKQVNDTLGHHVGDVVLREAAARMAAEVRATDTVARIGGDEFVVVCPGIDSEREVTWIAQRLVASLAEPYPVGELFAHIGVSIGVAMSHRHRKDDSSTLIREADVAMYTAKENGRSTFETFDDGMRERTLARLALETDLRNGIRNGELRVAYQPIVRTHDQAVLGAEALVRWEHPTRGLLGPSEFIEIAESAGLISDLGLWVTGQAIHQLLRWERHPARRDWFVAVNVSPHQLRSRVFPTVLTEKVRQARLEPRRLQLEITETCLVDDPVSIDNLAVLRRRGFVVSLDDFGTGYSSLGSLRQLPIDVVKLDRSFISAIDRDPRDLAVVTAVKTMLSALGKPMVAEGVERPSQLELLRAMGCEAVQGFLLGRELGHDTLAGSSCPAE